ncbi:hypothetical protein [Actinocorallia aurantiaca]|uniref:Uncharacterized protein n=1 Tax=Actinocorallia aurantiaca TaxID=46204 RepID=A0ABP6GJ84_9ACTN
MSVLSAGTDPALLRERWLAALEELFPVPEGYREEVVDRRGALDILRCGDGLLEELVAAGLPCSGPSGAEWFDRYDLFNLALHSGSGASAPETGIRFALRWMGRDPSTWFDERHWDLSVALSCPLPDGCPAGKGDAEEPSWRAALPLPEAFGGRLLELEPPQDGQDALRGSGPDGFTMTARVATRGERRELRSPVLRDIVGEYDRSRWVKLPVELQARPELVLPHGVAPCISVSLDLAARCRDAGFEARTRRGWILGMLDLAHSWLEVVDSDGRVKAVDPVFGLLSGHADAPHPDFRRACSGSFFNRLLPSSHEADQPLFRHRCGGAEHAPATRTTVRTAPREGA